MTTPSPAALRSWAPENVPSTHLEDRTGVSLLCIYIAMLPMSMLTLGSLGSVLKGVGYLLLIAAVAAMLVRDKDVRSLGRPGLAWLLYVVYIALSVYWSAQPGAAYPTAIGMIQLTVLSFLLVQIVPDRPGATAIRNAWYWVAGVCLALLFAAGEQMSSTGRTEVVLVSGGSDPNEFTAYFLVPFALALDEVWSSRRTARRLVMGLFAVLMVFAVLLTGSRGGALAIVATTAVITGLHSLASPRRALAQALIQIPLAYAAFTVLLPFIPLGVTDRLRLEAVFDDRGSGRFDIWREALSLGPQSDAEFFLGRGALGLPEGYAVMHNHFLQAYVDGGLIGLLLLLWLVTEILIASYRQGAALFGATVGTVTLLASLTAYAYFKPVWAIFMMALLPVCQQEPGG